MRVCQSKSSDVSEPIRQSGAWQLRHRAGCAEGVDVCLTRCPYPGLAVSACATASRTGAPSCVWRYHDSIPSCRPLHTTPAPDGPHLQQPGLHRRVDGIEDQLEAAQAASWYGGVPNVGVHAHRGGVDQHVRLEAAALHLLQGSYSDPGVGGRSQLLCSMPGPGQDMRTSSGLLCQRRLGRVWEPTAAASFCAQCLDQIVRFAVPARMGQSLWVRLLQLASVPKAWTWAAQVIRLAAPAHGMGGLLWQHMAWTHGGACTRHCTWPQELHWVRGRASRQSAGQACALPADVRQQCRLQTAG